jgi:hypothetical protein
MMDETMMSHYVGSALRGHDNAEEEIFLSSPTTDGRESLDIDFDSR